jgi:tripartite-type tricarboxylate transporter receptor subunit TctC
MQDMSTQHISLRGLLCFLGTLPLLFGSLVHADSYPTRPPKLVVPFSAGGISDFIGRVLAEGIQPHLGSPLIVENRPGASGNIGMDIVAKSPPDGYVVGLASVGFASNSVLQSRIPFNPMKDFAPVIMVGFVPAVVTVHPSLPVHTMKEFIELAKRRPDDLAFGSSGMGTGSHLAVELFKYATGTRMTHIPYKSTAQAVPDLLAGRIQFMFDFPTTAIEPIRAGKLRGLAVTSSQRSSELPDLPTVSEAGIKGYEFATWFGIFAPAGVPAPVAGKLTASFTRALESTTAKSRMAQQAIEISPLQPQEFAAFLRADIERWRKMLNQGHLALLD